MTASPGAAATAPLPATLAAAPAAAPAATDPAGEFISADDAAKLLGVTRRRIYQLVNEGRLPALHMGRAVKISRRGLDELHATATETVVDAIAADALRRYDTDALERKIGAVVEQAVTRGVRAALRSLLNADADRTEPPPSAACAA